MLLLAASAAGFAQSGPAAEENTASVEGMVVNAVTGGAVLRAHVTLRVFGRGPQRSFGAMTTAEGKFSVTGLPGGNYYVAAERSGFTFNWRGPGLELKPGEHKDDVKLTLTPTGAIAGTVVDANGEPVEHCTVTAESRRGGQWQSPVDAQGRFRIGGLLPGKYRIKATPEEEQTPPEIRTDGTLEAHYSQTYYPSTLDESSGEKVSAEPGAETSGIEIRLVRTPIVRVSGKVTGIPQGAENVNLMVGPRHDSNRGFGVGLVIMNNGWTSGSRVKKDGTFALWRLAPGAYRVAAQWNSSTGQMAATAPVDIVVGDSNVDGIELRMVAAAELTGQVEYEGDRAGGTDAIIPQARAASESARVRWHLVERQRAGRCERRSCYQESPARPIPRDVLGRPRVRKIDAAGNGRKRGRRSRSRQRCGRRCTHPLRQRAVRLDFRRRAD
jgi:hypothetical protein